MSRMSGLRASQARGAVLIEFAFALPLLLLLIVGIVDFGFLFQKYLVVTNAAREGARMAVLTGYTTADVLSRVDAVLAAGGAVAPPAAVVSETITPGTGTPFAAMKVTVTLNYTFTFLAPIATLFGAGFGTVPRPVSSVMRAEVAAAGS
jgi:Flp pilus assembly protein TadG